jgi:hypothetical protein
MIYRSESVFVVVVGNTLPDICDTIMFDVVVGIRKHERRVTAKSELLFVSDLGRVWNVE